MKRKILGVAFSSVLLALSTQVLAQSTTDADRPADAATQLSGPSPSATEEKKDDSASMGSSTAPAKSGDTFTHGESKRCESMTGADKDLCDKEEATKTEGSAAQEASKPQDASTGSSSSGSSK
jgi:hypothetical protein